VEGDVDTAAMDQIVDAHFGYEAADDVDGVLATLAPGATHHLIGSPFGPVGDPAVLRAFYEELFAACEAEGVEPVTRWYGDGFLVDESVWTGQVHDARLFGLPGQRGHVTFRILHVFDLDRGLITHERVWVDHAAIAEATG
jgi:hypothetical protein